MAREENLGQIIPNIQIGQTQTGEVGSEAQVENTGTGLNPIFNFKIPKGNTGETGATGPQGVPGPQGPKGDKGDKGDAGLTEEEVQDLIDASIEELGDLGFTPTVVQTLPVTDIDEHTIYLVPKTGETGDVYDEYLYINNAWEHIGSTAIDLSGYSKVYIVSGQYDTATFQKILTDYKNGTISLFEIMSGDYSGLYYIIQATSSYLSYRSVRQFPGTSNDTKSTSRLWYKQVQIMYTDDYIYSGASWAQYNDGVIANYLDTQTNYSTPYTPLYNGSPATKKYVDDSIASSAIQYFTMPTASQDTVGKIVQYTGGDTEDYIQGYFYIGTIDQEEVGGETVTTYGWENIEVQGGGDLSNYYTKSEINSLIPPIYTLEVSENIDDRSGQISLYTSRENASKVINDIVNSNKDYGVILLHSTNTNSGRNYLMLPNYFINSDTSNYEFYSYSSAQNQQSNYYLYIVRKLRISGYWNNGVFTAYNVYIESGDNIQISQILTKANTTSYNVTSDYNPAHKKYVDDITGSLSNLATTDQSNLVAAINEVASSSGGGSKNVYEYKPTTLNLFDSPNVTITDTTELTVFQEISDTYEQGEPTLLLLHFTNPAQCVLKFAFESVNDGLNLYGKVTYLDTNNYLYYPTVNIKRTLSDGVYTVSSVVITRQRASNAYLTRHQDLSNYLSKTNTTAYTPTSQYHPATKGYVDGLVGDINTVLATLTTPQGGE